MRVLFLITARGGSKGVPKKNIREIAGLPLLAFKTVSAQKTNCDKRIILSTDSEEIAAVGRKYGAEVPFMRPAELASDSATSMDVIVHAMNWARDNDSRRYDVLFLLEPSSPFGTSEQFNEALTLLERNDVDNVVSVRASEPNTRFIVPLSENGSLSILADNLQALASMRRQDFVEEYTPSGALYCAKWEPLLRDRTFYTHRTFPVIQGASYAVEIDSVDDLEYAEYLVQSNRVDMKYWR